MTEEKIDFSDIQQDGENSNTNQTPHSVANSQQEGVFSQPNLSPSADSQQGEQIKQKKTKHREVNSSNTPPSTDDFIKEKKVYNIKYKKEPEVYNMKYTQEAKTDNIQNNLNFSKNDPIGSSQTKDNVIGNDIVQPKKPIKKLIFFWLKFIFSFLIAMIIIFLLLWKVFLVEQITSYLFAIIGSAVLNILIVWIWKKWKKYKSKPKTKILQTDEGDIKVLSMDVLNVKRCPLCSHKILKGKVKRKGDYVKQIIKCKNPECDFKKELAFKIAL